MAPVSAYPPGLEHLDSRTLPEGFLQLHDHAVLQREIVKSPNDHRDYRLIRLNNGLEALLVHDSKADQSAAALSVRVGHLSDPDELPGLAHFCEHLLFQGNAKWPGENDYNVWLSQHTGWSNAYTDTDTTVYFYECANAGFAGALDRFSGFFTSPLFKESAVEREVRAVNSEHNKNLQNDGWRIMQLGRSLSKDGHPYQKFGTGSIDTLWNEPRAKGLNIRNELIKFYDKYYSANLMKLVLVSNESLDTLAARAIEHFSSVVDKNLPAQIFPGYPYDVSLQRTRTAIKTVTDLNALIIQFPFYDQSAYMGSAPATVVSHILGHEGPSSLYNFLHKKGLIGGLGVYPTSPAPGIDFFEIRCGLTKEGLAQHQLVTATIFEYIDLLRGQIPLPSWVFEEVKTLDARSFRFQESRGGASLADELSTAMQEPWPRTELLSAPYTRTEMDHDEIRKVLSHLVSDTCRVIVTSKEPLKGLEPDKREKWYGTEYTVKPLDKEWFKAQSTSDKDTPKFALPEPNRFLSSDLEVIGERTFPEKPAFPRALLVKETSGQQIWFKQDDRWKVPKANIFFQLSNPITISGLKHSTLTRFWIDLVNDALNEHVYAANVAGLGHKLSKDGESISISLGGYSDKLPELLKLVLHKMRSIQMDSGRFEYMKEEYLRSIDNAKHSSPLKQAGAEIGWLLSEFGNTDDQRKKAIESITSKEVQDFIPQVLSKMHLVALGHGNLSKLGLFEMVNMVEEILDYDRLSVSKLHKPRTRLLPESCNYVIQLAATSEEEVNNGIDYWCHVGHPKAEDLEIRLDLLLSLIQEPAFDILRTQEQLGYLVNTGWRIGASHLGFRIVIQSERNPVYLEKRINAFLKSFVDHLENMSPDFFDGVKSGLATQYKEDYKEQSDESHTLWRHVSNRLYDFDHNERMVALLAPLTKEDIQEFFMKYIHPSSAARAKASVHVSSQRLGEDEIKPLLALLDAHGVDAKPLEVVIKTRPLPAELKKAVAELIGAKVEAGGDAEEKQSLAADLKEAAIEVKEAILKPFDGSKALHECFKEEILSKVDRLGQLPDAAEALLGTKVVESWELKKKLKLGEAREPRNHYYDGVATKL